jgi:hypothetical protein
MRERSSTERGRARIVVQTDPLPGSSYWEANQLLTVYTFKRMVSRELEQGHT